MPSQRGSDLFGVLRGLLKISIESLRVQENYCKYVWANSTLKPYNSNFSALPRNLNLQEGLFTIEKFRKEAFQRTSMVIIGVKVFTTELQDFNKNYPLNSYVKEHLNEVDSGFDPKKIKASEGFNNEIGLNYYNLNETLDKGKLSDIMECKSTKNNLEKEKKLIEKVETEAIKNNLSEKKLNEQPVKPKLNEQVHKENITDNNESDTSDKGIPFKYQQSLSENAKQTKVPSSRFGRIISFGSLAAGLGVGTVAEMTRRTLGLHDTQADNPFLTPANAERIVATLCKVRGAALKLGQILSIQDNNVISPTLQQAFERVRQSADFMPWYQVEKVLVSQLGEDWRSKFQEFEKKPFAAASIGQVHYGKTLNGTEVAIKIQYPGVAKSINSDIENLVAVLNLWNIFPDGMFIEKVVDVAKKELAWEVDYIREAQCTKHFKTLLQGYKDYYVPAVIDELSTREVFTSELIHGLPVDKCIHLDEKTKNYICALVLKLCLLEMFNFRYMQTDPNWSNFFYNQDTKKLILLDFGATRSYDKLFMDKYLSVIKAAADKDRKKVLEISRDMGFLTGYESKAMENAHVDTVMILGEVFSDTTAEFDFARQDTTLRVTKLVPTILQHRLCPPPEEIYSLHRKLSGVFLLCAKLGVKLPCRDLFMDVYNNYIFG